MKSDFNKKFIFSRIRVGAIILCAALYFGYKYYHASDAYWAFIPPFIVLIFYLNFTLSHLFEWEFLEDQFTRKKILWRTQKKHNYADISSYKERRRFGTVSRNESLPNYNEIVVWMKDKQSFTFDEIDFSNYNAMRDYFIERCQAHEVEVADYED